jgi:CheY-like chemotaxis protein/two-component sensor histidine kinase
MVLELVAGQVFAALEREREDEELSSVRTALAEAEGQIARTRRARAVGEMAAGIAHDFNNCLTTILGFTELALGPLNESDAYYTDLATIRMAALDAAKLVKRLQTIGRRTRTTEERETVDLREIAKVMPELARPRWSRSAQLEGVVFEIVVDAQIAPPVFVVPAEIRELLLNLLFNAVDAMPSGGRITISTATTGDGFAHIAVSDQGTGMTPDVLAQVFKPFFTTKGERGCGLGLSVCRNIAQRHGGTLEVDSKPGEGTTFTLKLPPAEMLVTTPVIQREVQPPAAAEAETVVRHVLLIDDQEEVRESVGEMLKALGHRVVTAADGAAALAEAERSRPDVILTDFGMPGMNGVEVARRFLASTPDIPIVLITGWGLDPDAPPPPENVASVISKPVTMNALREVMAKSASALEPARRQKCS